ncbi:hypothetical protein FOZ63_014151, partial [Perkinsus olseni]
AAGDGVDDRSVTELAEDMIQRSRDLRAIHKLGGSCSIIYDDDKKDAVDSEGALDATRAFLNRQSFTLMTGGKLGNLRFSITISLAVTAAAVVHPHGSFGSRWEPIGNSTEIQAYKATGCVIHRWPRWSGGERLDKEYEIRIGTNAYDGLVLFEFTDMTEDFVIYRIDRRNDSVEVLVEDDTFVGKP